MKVIIKKKKKEEKKKDMYTKCNKVMNSNNGLCGVFDFTV